MFRLIGCYLLFAEKQISEFGTSCIKPNANEQVTEPSFRNILYSYIITLQGYYINIKNMDQIFKGASEEGIKKDCTSYLLFTKKKRKSSVLHSHRNLTVSLH